jgi:hypothetical protein
MTSFIFISSNAQNEYSNLIIHLIHNKAFNLYINMNSNLSGVIYLNFMA